MRMNKWVRLGAALVAARNRQGTLVADGEEAYGLLAIIIKEGGAWQAPSGNGAVYVQGELRGIGLSSVIERRPVPTKSAAAERESTMRSFIVIDKDAGSALLKKAGKTTAKGAGK